MLSGSRTHIVNDTASQPYADSKQQCCGKGRGWALDLNPTGSLTFWSSLDMLFPVPNTSTEKWRHSTHASLVCLFRQHTITKMAQCAIALNYIIPSPQHSIKYALPLQMVTAESNATGPKTWLHLMPKIRTWCFSTHGMKPLFNSTSITCQNFILHIQSILISQSQLKQELLGHEPLTAI